MGLGTWQCLNFFEQSRDLYFSFSVVILTIASQESSYDLIYQI